MLDEKPTWVAVMTYPQAEFSVARHFENDEPHIEYYLPLLMGRDRRYKRNPMQAKPMFPCYLFARINNRQIYQTRTTTGVFKIVSINHSIVAVPQSDIDNVRAFEAAQRKVYVMESAKLVKGAEVEITSGEFSGMRGTMLKGCKEGNFCVKLDVLNLSFVIHVKRDEIAPLDASTKSSGRQ